MTEEILVTRREDGSYAMEYGMAYGNKRGGVMYLTSNLSGYGDVKNKKYIKVAMVVRGNLEYRYIKTSDLKMPDGSDSSEQQQYMNAYRESGLEEYESNPENDYQTSEEQLNGTGAHEEVHMADPENVEMSKSEGCTYDIEKQAMETEIQSRDEYRGDND